MAEKRGKEEYRLPEDENLESQYEEAYQFSEQPERPAFSVKNLLLNKKVWVPALILIGVYGLYKFMEHRDAQQMKVQQSAEVALQKKSETIQSQRETMIKNDLQTAVQQANRNQAQLETIGRELNQFRLTQTQMNSELSEVSEAIKRLAEKLERPRLRITEKPSLVRKRRIRRYHRPAVQAPLYHLRAMVPGRAWLESSSGRLFTVKRGERIIGYGEVEEIDVTRGVVVTSSGRNITYGKYDS